MSSPLIIAHRGYNDKFPENTLAAFKGAVAIDVDVIETDLQVSKDGIVVINHDRSTERTYDRNLDIGESTVEELKQLVNKRDANEKIVTLVEFLEWFVQQPEKLKVMLDIKAYNDVSILAKVIRALLDVNEDITYWHKKVIFGIWSVQFYDIGVQTGLLANFELVNITISPTIALAFLKRALEVNDARFKLSHVSMLTVALLAHEFPEVRRQLDQNGVELYVWTSNTAQHFKLARSFDAKGIVTDKPEDLREFNALPGSGDIIYVGPPFFSKAGVQQAVRFSFFRVFEFILLRNLLRFTPVRLAVTALLRKLSR